MLQNKLHTTLQALGLSPVEIDIYVAVLQLSRPTAKEVAKRINKERNATYFHIKNLVANGLLQESKKGRSFCFSALPPAELAASYDKQVAELKSLVPELESLRTAYKHTPIIQIQESHAGYYGVYDEISSMAVGSTMRVTEGRRALEQEFKLLTEKEWLQFHTRMVERKIETRAIFTDTAVAVIKKQLNVPALKQMQQRVWHLKTLPEEILAMQQLSFIYGHTVAFLFPDTQLVVKIKHPDIARVYRASFDALFQFAKPRMPAWK